MKSPGNSKVRPLDKLRELSSGTRFGFYVAIRRA